LKKIIFLLLFFGELANAQDNKIRLSGGLAYNISDLTWSIAGNSQGQSPNILSELDFKSVASLGYFLEGRYSPLRNFYFILYYQHNSVFSGKGSDVDYQGDNRTNSTYQLSFSSNRGQLDMIRTGINTTLLKRNAINFTAGIYYRSNIQEFYILSAEDPDLESIYKMKMKGMELTVDADIDLGRNVSALLSFSCGYINYRGEANWNLREIFMHPLSFLQTSKGISTGGEVRFDYRISPLFSLTIGGTYSRIKIFKGTDTSYLITDTEVSTQFNGAKNNNYGSTVGIIVRL
jgi:hypothetical protein